MTSRLPGISAAAFLCAAAVFGSDPAKLVETVCTACHSLDVVTKKQLTKTEWTEVVKTMVAKGAPLKPDEATAVTDYLNSKYGNRGKELVESVCVLCHEFARISTEALTRDQWVGEIRGMVDEGAPLTKEEFDLVVDYLTKTYGVKDANGK